MKSNLLRLTIAVFMAFAVSAQAQTPPATLGAAIINDGFESWTGSTPNNWMKAPVTTIPASGVSKSLATGTLLIYSIHFY